MVGWINDTSKSKFWRYVFLLFQPFWEWITDPGSIVRYDRFKLRKLLLTESPGNVGFIGDIGFKPYVYVVYFSCQN